MLNDCWLDSLLARPDWLIQPTLSWSPHQRTSPLYVSNALSLQLHASSAVAA